MLHTPHQKVSHKTILFLRTTTKALIVILYLIFLFLQLDVQLCISERPYEIEMISTKSIEFLKFNY